MRKFLAVVASMMLVLGFAASAFAVHADIPSETQAVVAKGTTQITLGGSIRVRGEIRDNTATYDDDSATEDRQSYYDQRLRLRVQADVSKNTTGVIHLENGASQVSSDVDWGSRLGENAGSSDYKALGNYKQAEFTILEAWIQHKGAGLLGVPAGFKVGHMPVKLGYGLFFDHSKFGDDALNLFVDPMKDFHIELLGVKLSEGLDRDVNDDANMYSLLLSYNLNKDTSIAADVTYIDAQNQTINATPAVVPATQDYKLWNLGVRGQTKIAGLGVRADFEYQTGELDDTTAVADDIKAYAFLVGVDYTLAPVKLSAEFAYGSGDDDTADDDIETFQTFQSAIQKYTYVYDYRSPTAFKTGTAASSLTNTGIANTWYVKLGASADIMKDLNALVNVYYLRASEDILNTIGEDDKDIGIEVDGKITYKIDRNLVYWVEGGYLFAGDATKAIRNSTDANDDAYAVRHGIELSF